MGTQHSRRNPLPAVAGKFQIQLMSDSVSSDFMDELEGELGEDDETPAAAKNASNQQRTESGQGASTSAAEDAPCTHPVVYRGLCGMCGPMFR